MDVEEYSFDSRSMISHHSSGHHHLFAPVVLDSSEFPFSLKPDESDGDDDSQASFPCPYCYINIAIRAICLHLQEEHCFDMRNAVCPLCATGLGRDMIEHLKKHHSDLIKRRKPMRSSTQTDNNNSMNLGKDLQDVSAFLGVTSLDNKENAPDDSTSNANYDKEAIARPTDTEDVESKMKVRFDKEHAQDTEEMIRRAEFVQQLLLSTIF